MGSTKDNRPIFTCIENFPENPGYSESPCSKSNRTLSLRDKIKIAKKMGKGRAKSMVIGAASVMNKWPDHLLLCWLGAMTFLLLMIGCIVIMSTFGKYSEHASTLTHQERCLLRHTHASAKNNILSNTNMFLHIVVNNGDNFDPLQYKVLLKTAVKSHPGSIVNMYVLFNDLLHTDYKRNSRLKTWKLYHDGAEQHNFFDTSSAEVEQGVVNLIQFENQSNIKIIQSTLSEYFKHSPLKNTWRTIPQDLIPATMRILSVWENGGISMAWNLFLDKNHVPHKTLDDNSEMRNRIEELKKNFSVSTLVKPQDPLEIQKNLIERMKFDLRDVSTDRSGSIDFSNSDEMYEIYKKLKSRVAMKTNNTFFNAIKKTQYVLPANHKYQNRYPPKKTATNLGDDPESYSSTVSSSYYYNTYSSSYSYDSSEDGLPRSYESVSSEFRLRPALAVEHVQNELLRYVNRKPEQVERKRRALLSYQGTSTQSYQAEEQNQNKIRNPFKELTDGTYNIDGTWKRIRDNLRESNIKLALQRSESSDYSTEYYSSESASSYESDYLSGSSELTSSSESEDSQFMSVKTLQKLFGPMSEEHHIPHLYIKEDKGYKDNKAFDIFNIFALPDKSKVILDESGYYISARRPCNEFLSELITILQNSTDFLSSEEFLNKGLTNYCHPNNFFECDGIALVHEYAV